MPSNSIKLAEFLWTRSRP